jgi:hypothetical protein
MDKTISSICFAFAFASSLSSPVSSVLLFRAQQP